MATTSLPPGFRFHPTDVELVLYYLKRKVLGKPLSIEALTVLDLYKFEPWDLPEKSCLRSKDLVWYFFCPRDRKYANGPRTNRATGIGYWKTTGRDRAISNDSKTVGMKKTLIFHVGRAPQGTRTNWVMHEYRLEIKDWVDSGISQDSYVLCKIFEKSGAGPKNGEQHGAPFREEDWEDHSVDKSFVPVPHPDSGSPSIILDDEKISTAEETTLVLGKTINESLLKPHCQNGSSIGRDQNDSSYVGHHNDLSYGEHHNDSSYGRHFKDSSYGGHLNDSSYGGHLNDSSDGGHQPDSSNGRHLNDSSYGGHLNDSSYGGHQPDSSNGGHLNDSSYGGHLNDSSYGGHQPDSSNGEHQHDSSNGEHQADSSNGGRQADSSNGGHQNDSSNGSGENLSLIEDVDTDSTTSNEENDQFRGLIINNEATCISALLELKTSSSLEDKEEPLGLARVLSMRKTGKRSKKIRPLP